LLRLQCEWQLTAKSYGTEHVQLVGKYGQLCHPDSSDPHLLRKHQGNDIQIFLNATAVDSVTKEPFVSRLRAFQPRYVVIIRFKPLHFLSLSSERAAKEMVTLSLRLIN
jgi:hypothetical protein